MDAIVTQTEKVESKLTTLEIKHSSSLQKVPIRSVSQSTKAAPARKKKTEHEKVSAVRDNDVMYREKIQRDIQGVPKVSRRSDSEDAPSLPSLLNITVGPVPELTLSTDRPRDNAPVVEAEEGWTEVKKKSHRRPQSLCCTAGPSVTTLKAVERRKYLHLWNMMSGPEDVKKYVEQLCAPEAVSVEQLSSRGDYKSYKIGVPMSCFDTCFSIDIWPDNARVREWMPFREYLEAYYRSPKVAATVKHD